jgi:hypothetical protein
MKKLLYLLFFATQISFAQQKKAIQNCPCTGSKEISAWAPELKKGYDQKSIFNNFAYTVNGIYIAEDRDTVYQIKIIVDPKSYGTFVYYQHLSFSKARVIHKQATNCETSTNVHDGGWVGNNIFEPKNAINKQFVASGFFVGESYLRVDTSVIRKANLVFTMPIDNVITAKLIGKLRAIILKFQCEVLPK